MSDCRLLVGRFGRLAACPAPRLAHQSQFLVSIGRRHIQISATPSIDSPNIDGKVSEPNPPFGIGSSDAQFEVLGSPYSLLSVSLSASQKLYTRRGTLVGLNGKAENVVSVLSVLKPLRRAALGIPFLYQKLSSTTPFAALISTKSPITSCAVVRLDGTIDWMIAQRRALLAWTGHSITINPMANTKLSLAHWGNSQVTGRGLVALVGKGQIFQITLKAGEEYVAHPSNIVAYTVTRNPPLPYRLKSSTLQLQIPGLSFASFLPDTKFFRVMGNSDTWKSVARIFFSLRTWSRRTIWGDRLFLQFYGPTTILLQSRASRLSDVLSSRDINEIADAPPGAIQAAVTLAKAKEEASESKPAATKIDHAPSLHVASVGPGGKVKFQDADNFKSFL
ncbi:MAG: Altered inheritance of mitochondria protein 24, mitochondrial [Trizodia sp. TS-e1964]|nr:MAG: Altered inheritance of mitochondria protein 24, mitochondrial [Trizodia sp. TS-e1964]